ncbi:MAG: M28 family peptidase [Bdellovibrionales bacterium]|nr:M28 family peptidase [Bdellovibrionales bacterium]
MKKKIFLALLSIFPLCVSCKNQHQSVSQKIGSSAYEYTKKIISYGPRPPASQAHLRVQEWIEEKGKEFGLVIKKYPFEASTPIGNVAMTNLSFVVPGAKGLDRVMFVAHYESKTFDSIRFVGANDAASSVALLLALIPIFQKSAFDFDVEIALMDGEEAYHKFDESDGFYGSKRYAKQSLLGKPIRAVIGVDMIGDKDLQLIKAAGIDLSLLDRLRKVLRDMKKEDLLSDRWMGVADDHSPFVELNLPVLHLMDFTFGGKVPPGTLWHTEKDTIENISQESLSTVAEVIIRLLEDLDKSTKRE